jgi:hypothetical protein
MLLQRVEGFYTISGFVDLAERYFRLEQDSLEDFPDRAGIVNDENV